MSAAAAAARERLGTLFTTGGMGFRDLAVAHVTSTFGDTLVTVGLAGTLFFSVPSAEARGNVALYLLLTVAPFAVIGPLLGRMLDRHPSATRAALIGSALLRVVAAIWAVWLLQGLLLFPAAFGLLVLSRVHGIARNALLPVALDEPTKLVAANARLAMISVVGGATAAPVGGALGAAGLVLSLLAEALGAWPLLIPVAMLLGAGYGLCLAAGLTAAEHLAAPEARGALTASFYAVAYLGFAAPVLVAAAARGGGFALPLGVVAAGSAILALLLGIGPGRRALRSHHAPEPDTVPVL